MLAKRLLSRLLKVLVLLFDFLLPLRDMEIASASRSIASAFLGMSADDAVGRSTRSLTLDLRGDTNRTLL